MIRYTLKCDEGHTFDSWFKGSEAFDTLSRAGQISCALCGSTRVEKSIMAPAVGGTSADAEDQAPLSMPQNAAEMALANLRQHLKENSDYVGKEFADEARRIHIGEAEQRGIWGEATADDAKALKDEGIPVAPIPWMSRQDD